MYFHRHPCLRLVRPWRRRLWVFCFPEEGEIIRLRAGVIDGNGACILGPAYDRITNLGSGRFIASKYFWYYAFDELEVGLFCLVDAGGRISGPLFADFVFTGK
jgi:hypothetical protein